VTDANTAPLWIIGSGGSGLLISVIALMWLVNVALEP